MFIMDHSNFPISDTSSIGNDFPNHISNEPNHVPTEKFVFYEFMNDGSSGECSNVRDYTPEFTTNQIFESRDAMLDYVRGVGKKHGFGIVIKKSSNMSGGKMPRCILTCARGGVYKPPPEGHIKQRDSSTNKCDCPFKIRCLSLPPKGVMWSFKVVDGTHNHSITEGLNGNEYLSRLTVTQKQLVRDLYNNTAPKEILNVMIQQDPSSTPNIRSIYNVKALYKKELGD